MLKIGIVGGGHIVQHRHIPVFQKMKDVEVYALCDKEESIAKNTAAKFKIKSYFTDISDMLKSGVDIVDICTPPKTHFSLALEAIEAGCHVIAEKPLAMNVQDVEKMYSAANKNNVKLCVVHQNLYNPVVIEAKKLVQSGEVGDILNVEVGTLVRKDNYMMLNGQHWCHKLTGGIFFELLPHPIYLLQLFLKNIKTYCVLPKKLGSYDWVKSDELRALVDSQYAEGLVVSSCNSPFHGDFLNIFGTKMYLQIDLWGRSIIKFKPRTEQPFSVGKNNLNYAGQCLGLIGTTVSNAATMAFKGVNVSAHYGFIEAYIHAIKSNSKLPVGEEEAKDNVRIVEEICSGVEKKLIN